MRTERRVKRHADWRHADHGRRGPSRLRIVAAVIATGLLAVGLAGARPVAAAGPTMAPYVEGQHVYGAGTQLSRAGLARAEKLAAHIEAQGGGRVAIWLEPDFTSMPSTDEVMSTWQVDGLLIEGSGDFSSLKIGPTLKAKLSSQQYKWFDRTSSPSMATPESWITSTLARVDAFLGGGHVFDGPGVLDATALAQAETTATNLGKDLKATVYVDISYGGDDAAATSFFIGADMSSIFDDTLDVALSVSDNTIGGYIDSTSNLWDSYTTGGPWSNDVMSNRQAANGDVQAALLDAIKAISRPPLVPPDAIPWIIFVIVIVALSLGLPLLFGARIMRRLAGVPGPIANGVPGTAVIESVGDTGVTVTMPSVGPDAPDYKLGLQVTPGDGRPSYHADVRALIPRIFVPMIVPGARVGVMIDPANPARVTVDFDHFKASDDESAAGAGTAAAAKGAFNLDFDPSGQPNGQQVSTIVSRVHAGTMPMIHGSADQLLATGTHGTAVITTASPLGKTVRDVNPNADPSRLDDPMWMFTLEVKLPGQDPFPAVMGHRVPVSKLALLGPGVKLAVAVDESDKHNEVAIDWDKSPITS